MHRVLCLLVASSFALPLVGAEGSLTLLASTTRCPAGGFTLTDAPEMDLPLCPVEASAAGNVALDGARSCYWSAYGDLRCWFLVTGFARAEAPPGFSTALVVSIERVEDPRNGWQWYVCNEFQPTPEVECTFRNEPYGAIIIGIYPGTCERYQLRVQAYAIETRTWSAGFIADGGAPFDVCVGSDNVPSLRPVS